MKSNLRCFVFLFVCTFSLKAFALKTGDIAPDFSLPSTQGKSVSLKEFKGKHIVLEWTNHECPFVKKFYVPGEMQKLQKEWTSKGVIWLSINSSAKGKQGNLSVQEHLKLDADKKASMSFKLLDESGTVGKLYEAKTTPHMYVIDPKGVLIYQGAIDSNDSSDSEDIKKATNYVSEALSLSMSSKPIKTATTKPYGCSIKY